MPAKSAKSTPNRNSVTKIERGLNRAERLTREDVRERERMRRELDTNSSVASRRGSGGRAADLGCVSKPLDISKASLASRPRLNECPERGAAATRESRRPEIVRKWHDGEIAIETSASYSGIDVGRGA